MSERPAPWAPPDSTAAQPSARTADAPGPLRSPAASPPERPGLPPVPVVLRPMTTADLLDGAFAIIKRRPRDVLTMSVLLVIPIEVVSAVLLRDVLGEEGLTGIADPTSTFAPGDEDALQGLAAGFTSFAIGTLSLALLAGALAVMVDAWYRGVRVGPGSAVATALRRSWALLSGTVVVHLFEAVGLLAFGVGAYLVMALCHVVSPVVTAERLGPFAAIRRSVTLTRRRMGAALVVPALVGLVGMLVGFGFQAIPEVVAVVVSDDWDWLVRSAGQLASQLLVVPFTAGVAVLFHLDLRVRVEAHDIELRSRALLAR